LEGDEAHEVGDHFMIASYKSEIDGIKMREFKFMGHGWMYVYNGNDPEELKKVKADKNTFEIPDVPQKKNTPSSVFLRSGSSKAGNQPARPKRSCCGGRK